ncbi:hypothetical protein LP421_01700 (plasmid) [Rhizobium sp. RCAM05350]|nr:hypothetical protein LP421_01700 [Rhizobium sp. RCAM05350]
MPMTLQKRERLLHRENQMDRDDLAQWMNDGALNHTVGDPLRFCFQRRRPTTPLPGTAADPSDAVAAAGAPLTVALKAWKTLRLSC